MGFGEWGFGGKWGIGWGVVGFWSLGVVWVWLWGEGGGLEAGAHFKTRWQFMRELVMLA